MADIRINALATTAASTASDDFVAVDGSANGTRKLNAYSPTFGGNLTVSGDASIGTNVFKIDSTNTRILLGLASALQGDTLEIQSKTNAGAISLFGRASDNQSVITFRSNGSNTQKASIQGGDAGISLVTGLTAKLSIDSAGATTLAGNLTVSGGTIGTAASTNLTLNGGSSGASLVIAQGVNAGGTFTNKGTGYFTFNGPNFSNPDSGGTVLVYSNDSAAIDKGGSLLFGGSYTGTTQTVFAGLAGRKENATAGNYAGYLQFYTGTQASALEEVARLTSTGNFLVGTTTDSGNGKLQLATHNVVTGGIGFGTDTALYRDSQGKLRVESVGGGTVSGVAYYINGTNKGQSLIFNDSLYLDTNTAGASIILRTGATTTALTLDSSQRCILAGALRLNNAYTAGAPTATGYVTIQDSAGNTYKVLVGT